MTFRNGCHSQGYCNLKVVYSTSDPGASMGWVTWGSAPVFIIPDLHATQEMTWIAAPKLIQLLLEGCSLPAPKILSAHLSRIFSISVLALRTLHHHSHGFANIIILCPRTEGENWLKRSTPYPT